MKSARWSKIVPSYVADMVVLEEPKLNRVLLGCCEAPLKNGSSKTKLQMNGIDRIERHQMHQLTSLQSYFYACHVPSEQIKLSLFSCQK